MIEVILYVVILAFVLEFIDASFGMGYGTLMTPLLLIIGFKPLEVIPAILLTNFVIGITAALFHHGFGNIDLSRGSEDRKLVKILAGFGIAGVLIASFIAVNISEIFLEIYVAALIIVIGMILIKNHNKRFRFSWPKIMALGTLAAFNKGMTGGGYGSLLVGGQILSGIKGKRAIGTVLFAEGIVALFGFLSYIYLLDLNLNLVASLLIGGMLATPLAAHTVRRLRFKSLRIAIGLANILLGLALLTQLFYPGFLN